MRAYCLSCEIPLDISDIAQSAWYGLDMLGCEEEMLGESKVRLKCYFKDSVSLHSAEFNLMDIAPSLPVSITVIADQDWNANWKRNMKPVEVTSGVWVSPTWLKPPLKPGDRWIKIEPKMAFGTGHHETTRLASQGIIACQKALPAGFTMLDIGTGSGILCFVADYAGASMTIGVDMDGVCLPNLAENRRKNKTTARLHFSIGTIDMFTKDNMADLVVMNMISSEAIPLLSQIAKLLKPKGFFVWSGLLLEEKDIITEKALQYGFVCIRDSHENEWWSGCFELA